jgi:cobalt/nickel transport system permease protein
MYPLAVHISDGFLPPVWQIGGFVAAGTLLILYGRRLTDAEIPRLALLSAVFFVASTIHVRVGPTSVHLLLGGLVGVVLGRRAVLAITVGLVLQAALIGHGGFYSLGVNICDLTLPAYLAAALFAGLRRMPGLNRPLGRELLVAGCVMIWGFSLLAGLEAILAERRGDAAEWLTRPGQWWALRPPALIALVIASVLATVWERRLENSPDFPIGLFVGEISVLATVGLTALVLRLALPGEAGIVAPVIFVAHLPIAAIEGVVCGFAVAFLLRVAPNELAMSRLVEREHLVQPHFPLPQADADHG